jgi:hypothetical protein
MITTVSAFMADVRGARSARLFERVRRVATS